MIAVNSSHQPFGANGSRFGPRSISGPKGGMIAALFVFVLLGAGVMTSLDLASTNQDLRRAASTDGTCVAEGERANNGNNAAASCCDGLVAVSCDTIGANNERVNCGGSVCTKCGDGACGLGENFYNCEADCKPPVTCSWCGSTCAPDGADRSCTAVEPPDNQVCQISADMQNCEAVTINCLPKPSCMYEDPACEPDLKNGQSLCAEADLDGDSDVDEDDYALLSQHFFKPVSAQPEADLNRDGAINIFDYALLVKQWTGKH